VAIVIPTYNERDNIVQLTQRLEAVFSNNNLHGTIIVVDDNSPDGTGLMAEELSRSFGNIMVIHRPSKLGVGSAYIEGFLKALNADSDVIFEMDADLSHDPEQVPAFIEKISIGADVVIGSRYVSGGRIEMWPMSRRIISSMANKMARFLLGTHLRDLTSGYRAFKSIALKAIDLSSTKSKGYGFQVEVIHLSNEKKLQIVEIPIVFINRKRGASKLDFKEVFGFLRVILSIKFNTILKAIFR